MKTATKIVQIHSTALVVGILLAPLASFGQRSAFSSAGISGSVTAAYNVESVSRVEDPNYSFDVRPESRDRLLISIHLLIPQAPVPGVIQIVLALRTNADSYRMRAQQLQGSPNLSISFGTPQPGGDASQVSPAAVAGFSSPPGTRLGMVEQDVARGTRISCRGTFASPHNALLVPVSIRISPQETRPSAPASYQFRLSFGN